MYTAGQQWDAVAHTVASYVSNEGHAWQETIWTGDDLEGGWDQWTSCSTCYPRAQDFVNGMANKESSYSSHLNMVDYGDAGFGQANLQGGPVWIPQNVYDATWGIGWGVPVAELYVQSQLNPWICVYNNNCGPSNSFCTSNCSINESQGQLHFYGGQAQCSEADTLSTGNCWVQRSNACQWSPYKGYTNLTNATGDTSVPYSDNIRWQQDSPSGNNGC